MGLSQALSDFKVSCDRHLAILNVDANNYNFVINQFARNVISSRWWLIISEAAIRLVINMGADVPFQSVFVRSRTKKCGLIEEIQSAVL